MDSYIYQNNLKIKCNIELNQIYHFSVSEQIGDHAFAELSAGIETDSLELLGQEMNSQPIMIYSTKGNTEDLIFSGVICRICVEKKASYDVIYIAAYSVSRLMDLERKSRSFQGITNGSVVGLIQKVAEENEFQIICSGKDEIVTSPFIQYKETDWEFLLRLSTHLHLPLLAASDYAGKGIYVGFKEHSIPLEVTPSKEIWRMDAEQAGSANGRGRAGTYFEVVTGQILHVGQRVSYKNERLWTYEASMELKNGVLQCKYKLAGKDYRSFSTVYNSHIKGVSLTGTVLERSGETVKIHLDMDEEQAAEKAFPYLWLPEHGNMVYCMPETGSKIRLLIPGEDEREAIGIHCVRQNGQVCEDTQNPNTRCFQSGENKKITLQPSLIGITADSEGSNIILQDGAGGIISSSEEVLIQAKGEVYLQGSEVELTAPAEVTAIKRQLGSPTVVNICHNLDSIGRYSTFKNLGELKTQTISEKSKRSTGIEVIVNKKKKEKVEKEREKLKFKLRELMEDSDAGNGYELGASIVNILSSIPQCVGQDQISQIALGLRPIKGRMKGD